MESQFIDQTFRLHKANGSLVGMDEPHLHRIKEACCKYLFKTTMGDIISKYQTYQEIAEDLVVTHEIKKFHQFSLSVLLLRCPGGLLSRQTLIFINQGQSRGDNFNTLVLVRSTNAVLLNVLMGTFADLDLDVPLVVKELHLGDEYVRTMVNHLTIRLKPLANASEIIGDVQLVFQTSQLVSNESLKNIIVDVPEKDVGQLLAEDGLISSVNLFMGKHTKLNFNKLPLVRFLSRIVNLSLDGKLKILSDKLHLVDNIDFATSGLADATQDDQSSAFIWFLIASIYNENLSHQ